MCASRGAGGTGLCVIGALAVWRADGRPLLGQHMQHVSVPYASMHAAAPADWPGHACLLCAACKVALRFQAMARERRGHENELERSGVNVIMNVTTAACITAQVHSHQLGHQAPASEGPSQHLHATAQWQRHI